MGVGVLEKKNCQEVFITVPTAAQCSSDFWSSETLWRTEVWNCSLCKLGSSSFPASPIEAGGSEAVTGPHSVTDS